jgi:hypothetical protein
MMLMLSLTTILLDRYRSGTLPHAILLVGSVSASLTAVQELIDGLVLNPADYLILEAGESIKIADAKRIKNFVQMTRFTSPIKLVFMADASALTNEAANALLKTIEEPPEGSHIILATTKADALLPTISSRCQRIDLARSESVSNEEIPTLSRLDLATAFQVSKELATSDLSLTAIFSQWAQQLADETPNQENLRWQGLVLDYLGPAQTSVNRRLLLDNFFLEIYNSD